MLGTKIRNYHNAVKPTAIFQFNFIVLPKCPVKPQRLPNQQIQRCVTKFKSEMM